MSQILCSTGALIGLPNNRNHQLLEQLSKVLACDGFEFMMYRSWYETANEITEDLKNMNLNFPVMHCEKGIGELISRNEKEDLETALRLFMINCEIAKKISAKKIVIHLWNGIISDQHFRNNLKTFGLLLDIAKDHGIDLLVENVICSQENPMKRWFELTEIYPDIHFCFDTKMAAFHGQIDQLYQEEYRWLWGNDHVSHYHINDYSGGYMEWGKLKTLPIENGNIDFERFFSFIRRIGYDDTFTVEATAFNGEGIVDTDMLNICFEKIRGYVSK